MLNERSIRRFVPNEEGIYDQLLADPEKYIAAAQLVKMGLLGSGKVGPQLEMIGLPYLPLDFPRRGTFLIKAADVLSALGVSEWVRVGMVFAGLGGAQIRQKLEKAKIPVRQDDQGPLFVRRDDILRYCTEQKDIPIPLAPVQAAMPLLPPSAPPLDLSPALTLLEEHRQSLDRLNGTQSILFKEVLTLLEEHRESLDRLNGAQAILFKEIQVIRKGLNLILKDLVGSSAEADY